MMSRPRGKGSSVASISMSAGEKAFIKANDLSPTQAWHMGLALLMDNGNQIIDNEHVELLYNLFRKGCEKQKHRDIEMTLDYFKNAYTDELRDAAVTPIQFLRYTLRRFYDEDFYVNRSYWDYAVENLLEDSEPPKGTPKIEGPPEKLARHVAEKHLEWVKDQAGSVKNTDFKQDPGGERLIKLNMAGAKMHRGEDQEGDEKNADTGRD